MIPLKKFLPSSGAAAICCLALTGTLAFAQKATVNYPTAHATSKMLRELPIEARYVGRMVQTTPNEIIEVKFQEIDGMEKVILV